MTARSLALEIPVPLLEWLPGETFYSLCSRHHRFSGYANSADTTLALFGHRRSGSQHDLPSRLDAFAERTEGDYGDADSIARERTVLRFYAPFLPAASTRDAVASMRSASVAHLKYRLGLLTSRFRANHPLKACLTCIDACVRTYGWSAWLLEHQHPGVWVCRHHREPLLVFEPSTNGAVRSAWQLPSSAAMRCNWTDSSESAFEARLRLSSLIVSAVDAESEDGSLQALTLQEAFRLRLNELGLVTRAGNVRVKEVAGDFAEHCRLLRGVPELAALPASVDEAAAEIGRLVRPLRSGTHPIRLLTLSSWLFHDATELRLAIETSCEKGASEERHMDAAAPGDTSRRDEFLKLLGNGMTVRQASDVLGIAANTGIAWASTAGIVVTPRPKVLKPDVRAQLALLLRKGCERATAAQACGVSPATVDRLFQKEPQLHAAWRAARHAGAQLKARTAWLRATNAGGIKLARNLEPAAYAWLYRNDRPWLNESCTTLAQTVPERGASYVDWKERDAALAAKVRRALPKLAQSHATKLKLWHIHQAVPELKAKLSNLKRLPMTRMALEHALFARSRPRSDNETLLD